MWGVGAKEMKSCGDPLSPNTYDGKNLRAAGLQNGVDSYKGGGGVRACGHHIG